MSKGRARAPRGSLSADQIVQVACDLVASAGLDKFSMPEVARRLEVGVTSIYWYFRSREELLLAIADRVTAEFYAGLEDDTGLSGDDRVLQHFRMYWARLSDNPLWREVFVDGFARATAGSPEAATRSGAVVQRQIERMIDAGMGAKEAAEAYRILSAYTRGSVVVIYSDTATTSDAGAAHREQVRMSMSGAAAEGWAEVRGPDELFDAGLQALWSGLLAAARDRRAAGV